MAVVQYQLLASCSFYPQLLSFFAIFPDFVIINQHPTLYCPSLIWPDFALKVTSLVVIPLYTMFHMYGWYRNHPVNLSIFLVITTPPWTDTDGSLNSCSIYLIFSFSFFSDRLLSVLHGHSVFSSPPQRPMTSDFERIFYPRCYPLLLFSYLNSWERTSIFPFECSVLNKGTTGTIFITSLVWRGPWLGIEPGTSRTRSQHYTTRLSRRR